MRPRYVIPIVVIALITGVIVWRVRPQATLELIHPVRGPIAEYVEEEAATELPRDYLVAMPIAGWLEPIDLREGDHVKEGQIVARLDTADLQDQIAQIEHQISDLDANIAKKKDNTLEGNALVQAYAIVKAVDETVKAADAKLEASKAVVDFAQSEVERIRGLAETQAAAARELREAETNIRKARADYQSDALQVAALKTLAAVSYLGPKFIKDYIAQKKYDITSYEQQKQERQAQLEIAKRNLTRSQITSTIDGVVLTRQQTRRQYLQAGAPLLTLGRIEDMEVTADVLTERAMRISPGDPVEIFGEPFGQEAIPGKVLRVYPAGFKKVSSLGVEQQRVNVAIKMDKLPERLGVGFRVYVRIRYAGTPEALVLPRTALFRGSAGEWQVMTVRDGRTELRTVELGLMNDERAQVTKGIEPTDEVVARPSREIVPGMRVAVRR